MTHKRTVSCGMCATDVRGTHPWRRVRVFDRRVSSHEVGHILGLHHVLRDPDRLLFSGTNGMTLTEDEATVARYFAKGIIQGVR